MPKQPTSTPTTKKNGRVHARTNAKVAQGIELVPPAPTAVFPGRTKDGNPPAVDEPRPWPLEQKWSAPLRRPLVLPPGGEHGNGDVRFSADSAPKEVLRPARGPREKHKPACACGGECQHNAPETKHLRC
jgi:hypothetical protein